MAEKLPEVAPDTWEGWYELGTKLRREQRFGDAINAYEKSRELNPEGPAGAAIETVYNILRFVNKDLMNP